MEPHAPTIEGTVPAASPAEAVAGAETVVTMLSHPAAVRRAPGLRAGTVVTAIFSQLAPSGPTGADRTGRGASGRGAAGAGRNGPAEPGRTGQGRKAGKAGKAGKAVRA